MDAGEICKRDVVVAYRDMPLTEAAQLMRERHVGSLVVVVDRASERVPVGILTDRDIVVAVVAKALDPRALKVGDVMTGGVFVVREQDGPAEVLRAMRENGVRRVPVVTRGGALAGILAIDDLLELMSDELIDFVRTFARERVRESRTRRP
jgi:CBS domain-containing protein